MLNEQELAALRRTFHHGRRVRLVALGEPHPDLHPGAEGSVQRVDDFGTVHVEWDMGVSLGCVVTPAVDEIGDHLEPI